MGDIVDTRKPYIKPAIVFEKTIETLAAFCDSTWTGDSMFPCMSTYCDTPSA